MDDKMSESNRLLDFADGLTLRRILRLALLVALGVGVVTYLLVPRQYTASTTVLFSQRPDPVQSIGLAPVAGTPLGGSGAMSLMATKDPTESMMLALLNSKSVLRRVADKQQLGSILQEEDLDRVMKWLEDHTSVSTLQKSLAGGVGLKISVTCPGAPQLLRWIGVNWPQETDTAKRLAADLANQYITELNDYLTQSNVRAATEMRQFIEKRLAQVQGDLDRAENELQRFRAQHELMEPGVQATQIGSRLSMLLDEVTRYQAEIKEKTQALQASRIRLTNQQARKVRDEVDVRNPVIANLDVQIATLRMQLATALAEGKSREHPEVVALQSGIAEGLQQLQRVQGEILERVTSSINPVHEDLLKQVINLEISVAGLQARKREREFQLKQSQALNAQLPPLARRYGELERERVVLTEVLTTLRRRLEVAAIEERQEKSNKLQLLDPAEPPRRKSGPSPVRMTIMSYIVCLVLLGGVWAYRRGFLFEGTSTLKQS